MANLTTSTATTLIRLLLDKANSPYFTDAEIADFLELSIKEFINENYKKFEVDQATRDNLRTLVSSNTGLVITNFTEFALPADYRHFLSFEVETSLGDYPVKMIQLDDFLAIKNDPFNRASDDNVLGILEDNAIKVFATSNFFFSHKLTYLKWDESSDTIATLADHTHEDVVNIAVRKLMAAVKDEGYQLQAFEESKNKL